MSSKNNVGQILKLIGRILVVLGVITGILILGVSKYKLLLAAVVFISCFISGMIFIGFGENINLLHEINMKLSTNKTAANKKED